MEQKNRRKGIVIMGQLIGLVRPLLPIICLAIFSVDNNAGSLTDYTGGAAGSAALWRTVLQPFYCV